MIKEFNERFPSYRHFFHFDEFNAVQRKCYHPIVNDVRNMVFSAPTSSGKTVLFELAIIRHSLIGKNTLRCLYLAPIKSLCHEKSENWRKKFKNKITVSELTGDTNME